MEGFLVKRGDVRKTWKRRWFSVIVPAGASESAGCVVRYFSDEHAVEPLGTFAVNRRGCFVCTDARTEPGSSGGAADTSSATSSSSSSSSSSFLGRVRGRTTAGSHTRASPNVFSVIVPRQQRQQAGGASTTVSSSDDDGESDGAGADADDGDVDGGEAAPTAATSAATGPRLPVRRFVLEAPSRQLRLEWMALLARFAEGVVGDAAQVREVLALRDTLRQQVRRQNSNSDGAAVSASGTVASNSACSAGEVGRAVDDVVDDTPGDATTEREQREAPSSSTSATGASSSSLRSPAAAPEHVDALVTELGTFAHAQPHQRIAILVAAFGPASPRYAAVDILRLRAALHYVDDRETLFTLALSSGCFSPVLARSVARGELAESEANGLLLAEPLSPLEVDALLAL